MCSLRPSAAYRDATTIRLDSWPVAGGLVDDISAWFAIDWQYNGKSLGNIRIGNIGTNDAIGWGLHVRAQIMDDNILYQPGSCAALRLRFHYRFSRSIGSDVIGVTEVHLFGDGTYEQSSSWLQASALALDTNALRLAPIAKPVQRALTRPGQNGSGPVRAGAANTKFSRGLDADPLAIEVKYRMFIPSPLIDAPTSVFGGDGRDFSYSGGSSRGELTAIVHLTPGGGISSIDTLDRHWSESTEYNSSDAHAVAGKPSWWLEKNAGAQPIARAALAVSDDNLNIYVGATGTTRSIQATIEQASLLTIEAAGSLPLSSVAPAIDVDMSLLIRISGGRVEVKVQGEHDGFPCHELYVNRQRIYSYDPVAVGSSPTALMPPMDVTASTGWTTVATLATSQGMGNDELQLVPPPAARARAMDGGVSAAIAIGGFIVESIRDSAGDVTWELDQFAHIKHPNDVQPSPSAAYRDATTIRLDSWPVAGGLIDDISAWFSIDWQYNGKSLGNIRIGNIGTNDAIGWGLHVRAQIMDDNILYQPGSCAALRLRFHYRFSRSIGSDVIAVTEVHLFGDGTYEQSSSWLQASALALSANTPHITGSNGNVSWDLLQYPELKTPASQVAASNRIEANPIRLDDWPYLEEADGNRTQAPLQLAWAYDAAGSVGAVRLAPDSAGSMRSAGGRSLAITSSIEEMEDNPSAACLQVSIRYAFTHASEGEQIAITRIKLYGNGQCVRDGQWQSKALLPIAA